MLNAGGPGERFCFPEGGALSRLLMLPADAFVLADDFRFRRLLGGRVVSTTNDHKYYRFITIYIQ